MSSDDDLSSPKRNGKSEAAFRTISEVSEDINVPQHVLRFWESKFTQVKPLKRGGGRRYYRPEDVVLLRRIRDLLYSEGYTIKGVQKLLKEGGGREGSAAQPHPARATAALEDLFAPHDDDDLPLEMGEDEDEVDEEPDDGAAEEAAPPAPPSAPEPLPQTSTVANQGLQPHIRQELQSLLDDLEQMRTLLHLRQS